LTNPIVCISFCTSSKKSALIKPLNGLSSIYPLTYSALQPIPTTASNLN
jgi:hypothetical protein